MLGETAAAADVAGGAARPRDDAGVGVRRSARRADGHADPRGDVHGRAELGEGLRAARASFPGRRRRPARPWRRDPACIRGSGWRTARTISPRWPVSLISAGLPPWGIPWAAWWPSCCTGGTPALVSGLVFCSTARNARGSPAEQLAALAVPAVAAALRWNPMLHLMGAEAFGTALLGRIDDPATSRWARAQLRRTTLATARLGHARRLRVHRRQPDQPGRCAHRGGHHDPGPRRAARPPAGAGPGGPGRISPPRGRRSRGLHQRAALVRPRAAGGLLVGSAWPRQHAAHASQTRPARVRTAP